MITPGSPAQRRSSHRRSFEAKGFAVSPSRDVDVLLTDLSYGGCRVKTDAKLEPGENLRLIVPRLGAVPAEISWFNDGFAGVRFTA